MKKTIRSFGIFLAMMVFFYFPHGADASTIYLQTLHDTYITATTSVMVIGTFHVDQAGHCVTNPNFGTWGMTYSNAINSTKTISMWLASSTMAYNDALWTEVAASVQPSSAGIVTYNFSKLENNYAGSSCLDPGDYRVSLAGLNTGDTVAISSVNGGNFFGYINDNIGAANAPIDWNLVVFGGSAQPSSQTISFASSSALYRTSGLASSSIPNCNLGNIFNDGICQAFNFLFVPDPSVINGYMTLFDTSSSSAAGIGSRFPFSYVTGISDTWSQLHASSTQNFQNLSIDLSRLDFASSTPFGHILPASLTILSTTTVTEHMPAGFWDAMQLLIVAGIWLGLGADIFFTVRNKLHRV